MTIIYRGGERLECHSINFWNGKIIADEIWEVDIDEIDEITDEEL